MYLLITAHPNSIKYIFCSPNTCIVNATGTIIWAHEQGGQPFCMHFCIVPGSVSIMGQMQMLLYQTHAQYSSCTSTAGIPKL